MPQIGFTKKQSPVYHRFNALRRAYEDANGGGRIYNPDFLTVLMDAWERYYEPTTTTGEPQQVIIKQSDGALYLEKMLAHNHTAYLTPNKDEAMVFDNPGQAKAFLRKCGHEVGNWILEPVNESK